MKILGLLWDKKEDSMAIEIPNNKAKRTKREILSKLASVYNPLGLISLVHLRGKVVYWELCELKHLNAFDIHVFTDFSIIDTCAAAYAVTRQSGHVNQNLIANKSWLAKQNMLISRLELIAVHMGSNLAENIK